jgi:hypothetical protein
MQYYVVQQNEVNKDSIEPKVEMRFTIHFIHFVHSVAATRRSHGEAGAIQRVKEREKISMVSPDLP